MVRHVAPAAPAPRAVVPASSASTVQPQRTPAADPRAGIVLDRRGATCEMTRRIERTVAKLAAVPKRRSGAQTLDVAGGRIRLLVRTDGRSTRIVALCAVPLRERVERALAHARFTLAASGMAVAQ